MIKFKPKEFSNVVSGAITGAGIGASVGGLIAGNSNIAHINSANKLAERYNKLGSTIKTEEKKDKNGKVITVEHANSNATFEQRLALFGFSTVVGAALGALVGAVKDINNFVTNRRIGSNRLMDKVVSGLLRKSFKEDVDFTLNPKVANDMKTKVCMVLSHDAANFRLLVNVVDDKRLKSITSKITTSLKGNVDVRKNSATNRYNEINISTISNADSNARTTIEIASGFIKAGYPIYLVEVG